MWRSLSSCLLASHVASAVRFSAVDATNASVSDFKCPDACQHCCTAHSWDIGITAWGVSGSKYKCVLKQQGTLPSAECSAPEQRSHSTKQQKTECPFPADAGDEPWEELKKTPCPKLTSCCCDNDDAWSDKKCLDESADQVNAQSADPRAGGKEQLYVKDYQQFRNPGKCVGDVTASAYQKSMKGTKETHGKCCVQTEKKEQTVKIPNSCRKVGGYFCPDLNQCPGDCDFSTGMCGQHEECDYEQVVWEACKSFQALHYCSEDGGVSSNGKTHYYRKPTAKGKCYPSDACPGGSTKFLKDPETGRSLGSCKCDVACG